MKDIKKKYSSELIDYAKELGALDAKVFTLDEVVFDSRTLLKCMFGCGDWQKGLTCPSANPQVTLENYKEMLNRYSYGIIVRANNKKTNHDISFMLEQKAFCDGYYFAFSMSDCAICKVCAGFTNEDCINKKKARPAFHSVGIDVFATARNMDMPINTLSNEDDDQNWYAAVFVE